MESIDWGMYLPMVKTLSLPLLLLVGKWLKGRAWVNNQVIPYLTTGLNTAGWVLLHMGLVSATNGQLVPVVPPMAPADPVILGAVSGAAVAAVPLYAMLAWAIPGWLGGVVGTVASIGVEQFLVNRAHKGIKYRMLFKAAEMANIIPKEQGRKLRLNSKW